jgi:hypothetical protein
MALAACSAAISLLFLIACPVALAASQHGVSIKVITSQDDQFWTNSVLIEGAHEMMLVDAQLTKPMPRECYTKSKRPTSHSLLSTLPMSTPIIFLVWRCFGRPTRE